MGELTPGPRRRRAFEASALAVLALGALAIVRSAAPEVRGNNDVGIYAGIGEHARSGTTPFESEYPPLPSSIFALLSSLGPRVPFADAWLAFVASVVILLAACAHGAFSYADGVCLLVAFVATTALLGIELVLCRLDILVGLLVLFAWMAHGRGHAGTSAACLAIAGGLKVVPFALVPLLWVATPRAARRSLLGGLAAGSAVALVLPLAVLGPGSTLSNLRYTSWYHTTRGVQVESTWSGLALAFRALHGSRSPIEFRFGAHENEDLGSGVVLLSRALGLLGVLGLALLARRRSGSAVGWIFVAVIAWLLATSSVLSPQYLCWLVPLVLVSSADSILEGEGAGRREGLAVLVLGCLAGALTHWIYPSRYFALVDQEPTPVIVLSLRNLCLFVLAAACIRFARARWNSSREPDV